jgi:hypothetical protein
VELNKVNIIATADILQWHPGDFYRNKKLCGCGEYHTCVSIGLQWQEVLEIARLDERYEDIYKSVEQRGLVRPLAAKITKDDHVMMLDGHHRVGVSLQLWIREIPVWIGDPSQAPENLISVDSGWWSIEHTF